MLRRRGASLFLPSTMKLRNQKPKTSDVNDQPFSPLAGWKSRRIQTLKFYRCPNCSGLQEALIGSDGLYRCHGCRRAFSMDAFLVARVRRNVVECRHAHGRHIGALGELS